MASAGTQAILRKTQPSIAEHAETAEKRWHFCLRVLRDLRGKAFAGPLGRWWFVEAWLPPHGGLSDQIEHRLSSIYPIPSAFEERRILFERELHGLIAPFLDRHAHVELD